MGQHKGTKAIRRIHMPKASSDYRPRLVDCNALTQNEVIMSNVLYGFMVLSVESSAVWIALSRHANIATISTIKGNDIKSDRHA